MRATALLVLTVMGVGIVAGDALAYGKKLREKNEAAGAGQYFGRGEQVPGSPKPTPYGYNLTGQFPAYTTPHGYNQILFPKFNPIPQANLQPSQTHAVPTGEGEKSGGEGQGTPGNGTKSDK